VSRQKAACGHFFGLQSTVSSHAILGKANAQILSHYSRSSPVPYLCAALVKLHLKADGASEVVDGVEGGDVMLGSSLDFGDLGKHPYARAKLLGLLLRCLKG
jgi:hypothetical protein